MASPPSTPPPEAYSPSPIRAADPFSQSARPNLFSPEISRAKAMAREALVAPTLDNVAHQHRQDWPSYPPGATLAPLPGSPRQPMQVAQAALPSEDRVNEYIVEAYTRCGKPLPESQGSSYTRAAAMEGSCQRYDSEKFSSFDTVVEMQKRLEKLSQEREQLEQACEACDSENQRVAGASLTVREGNDMIAAKIQEVSFLRRSKGSHQEEMEVENQDLQREAAHLRAQIRKAIMKAEDEGAKHLDAQLDKKENAIRSKSATSRSKSSGAGRM